MGQFYCNMDGTLLSIQQKLTRTTIVEGSDGATEIVCDLASVIEEVT